MLARNLFLCAALVAPAASAPAQDRDTKVRNDLKQFANDTNWIYNDIAKGVVAAKESGRPMFVVFR
jgi:hypothetical protein